METPIQTNWYVITGVPSSGKSKLLEHLAFLGYSIYPEIARIIIDNDISKGKTIEEIRKSEEDFLKRITKEKILAEARIPIEKLMFWERAIPDDIAYRKCYGFDTSDVEKVLHKRRYKGIFILDMLPNYVTDYARTETKEIIEKLHKNLHECYSELGYKVISVPVESIENRAKYILKNIDLL